MSSIALPATSGGRPFNRLAYSVPTTVIRAVDRRAEFDDRLQKLHEDPVYAYGTSRAFYLQMRQAEIDGLHGKHASSERGLTDPDQ
jgi:phospholipid-binding lipoprotein MlaA